MTDFLGDTFVKCDGSKCGREELEGYKLIMIVYSASWWGGCGPFKANLKNLYNEWNSSGKNIQVVIVSGDQDQAGFDSTMRDAPWIAIPMDCDKSGVENVIPCTGYPTPGVINGATGEVIEADAFGKVDQDNYEQWLSSVWACC